MSLILHHHEHDEYLEIHVSGTLDGDHYRKFAPFVEDLIAENGPLRILMVMHDFKGWSADGMWEGMKFELKHWANVERVAFLSHEEWKRKMAIVCLPFSAAEIEYFPLEQFDEAREWVSIEASDREAS